LNSSKKHTDKEEGFVSYFERSGVLQNSEGWEAEALQLLTGQDGFSDVHVAGWELKSCLGTGATAAVFRAVDMQIE
jgi:hypothetical protein